MIRINLLPYRQARKQENVRRQVSVFFLGLVFIGIGLYYAMTVFDRRLEEQRNRLHLAKTELDQMKKVTKEIDEIKKKLNTIRKKTEIIRSLEADRKSSVILLERLSDTVVAQRMWFTGLTEMNDSVGITGVALDQTTVADFMKRLENCGLFSSVTLKSIKHQVIKGVELKNFDVVCRKVQKAPHPKGKEPAKGKGGA
ncbi:MAG: PilN domain-containing protein [Thermodesulfobacteriota bacterium]